MSIDISTKNISKERPLSLSTAGNDNEIGAMPGAQLDAQKTADRPVRLVRSLLFGELVKALE